jgi:uncharacterized protein (TIGR00369 family)
MSAGPKTLEDALAAMPYAGIIGMTGELVDGELTTRIEFRDDLVGNTRMPALHGGVIGAFLEMTALTELRLTVEDGRTPRTIGVTVEYLRPGRSRETFARATIRRLGKRVANVHVTAWQDRPETPIALLQGRFMVGDAPEETQETDYTPQAD